MIDIYSEYLVIDVLEKIEILDSFVVNQNKIGLGNGEAKLYIGQDNSFLRSFFGNSGFTLSCLLLKQELLKPAQNKHLQVKTVKYGQETL